MRKKGLVVGFHSAMALVEDLENGDRILCKLRGKFKKQGIKILVGDYVEYRDDGAGGGVIENILNRKNELRKPKVANVDQVILVTTLKEPEVPLYVLDKFLVLAEHANLPTIIVFNKIDLLDDNDMKELIRLEKYYGKYYETLRTSAVTGEGIEKLREIFKGKISTMAGMSGVGKSSLLNAMNPGLKLKIGEISEKLKRGKHTTTTTSLLRFDFGGYVADTPGFANLDISGIGPEDLKDYFADFREYEGMCAFADCMHVSEPGCYIRRLVNEGEIAEHRYRNYLKMLDEIGWDRD
jgi:ribosome biogenesis GTPase